MTIFIFLKEENNISKSCYGQGWKLTNLSLIQVFIRVVLLIFSPLVRCPPHLWCFPSAVWSWSSCSSVLKCLTMLSWMFLALPGTMLVFYFEFLFSFFSSSPPYFWFASHSLCIGVSYRIVCVNSFIYIWNVL